MLMLGKATQIRPMDHISMVSTKTHSGKEVRAPIAKQEQLEPWPLEMLALTQQRAKIIMDSIICNVVPLESGSLLILGALIIQVDNNDLQILSTVMQIVTETRMARRSWIAKYSRSCEIAW